MQREHSFVGYPAKIAGYLGLSGNSDVSYMSTFSFGQADNNRSQPLKDTGVYHPEEHNGG